MNRRKEGGKEKRQEDVRGREGPRIWQSPGLSKSIIKAVITTRQSPLLIFSKQANFRTPKTLGYFFFFFF